MLVLVPRRVDYGDAETSIQTFGKSISNVVTLRGRRNAGSIDGVDHVLIGIEHEGLETIPEESVSNGRCTETEDPRRITSREYTAHQ